MRYPAEHKQETRERIVRAASRQFRGRGEEGVAIADLMQQLHLTHGGFYRHFKNKEDLFGEGITQALEEGAEGMLRVARNNPGSELKALIERYLSPEHLVRVAEGCPVAALAADIARHPQAVRMRFQRAIEKSMRPIAAFVPGATDKERRNNLTILFSGMAGALNMARAVADEDRRQEILSAARDFYIRAFCT
jgi:TetR/AcrR family transcriptional repressor of nem operon